MSVGNAGKTQVFVDTTTIANGDSIAAYLADGSGNFLTSQLIQSVRRLDVNMASERAEDTAHTSGDYLMAAGGVRNDAGTALAADGDYIPFMFDANGRLYTNATSNFSHSEDSAASSGDIGSFSLSVRRDAAGVSNTSADGDYAEMQSWSNGELKTVDIYNETNLQQIVDVGTIASALPAAALARRKFLFVQNVNAANRILYLGSATVTADTAATGGFQIGKGGYVGISAGPGNVVYGISTAAATKTMVWEHA